MTTHPLLRTDARPLTTDEAVSEVPRIDRSPRARRERIRLGSFRTPVRGHAFAAVPNGAARPQPGSRARLAREPGNPADPLAVAVWVEHADVAAWRIGYLDRGVAARVAPRLDAGLRLEVRLDGWVSEPEGRWHRPLLHVAPDHSAPDRSVPVPGAADASASDLSRPDRSASDAGPSDPVTSRRDTGTATLWGRPPGVTRRIVRQA